MNPMCNRRVGLVWTLAIAAVGSTASSAGGDSTSVRTNAFSKPGNPMRYGTWLGSSWNVGNIGNIGGKGKWVVLRNCPTRNETVFAVLADNSDVSVAFFNGSSWGGISTICTDAGTSSTRPFSIAYEQASGAALIAYWNATQSRVGFRTSSGGGLSSESLLTLPSTSQVLWLVLVPRPESDEILLLASNLSNALYAVFWNGDSFGSVSTLETSLQTSGKECFAAAYQSFSVSPIVVYAENAVSSPRYRTWSGSAWSSESSLPSIGANGVWLRLVADPASDRLLFAALDDQNDINVNTWSGTAWGSNSELETGVYANDARRFDVAYEPDGTNGLIVYNEGTSSVLRYRTWNGSSFSAEQNGPDVGSRSAVVALFPDNAGRTIWLHASNSTNSLYASRWTGSVISDNTQLENKMDGTEADEQFGLAAPAARALVPANLPYSSDFESAPGSEWWPRVLSSTATHGQFAGRYRNTSLRLALNTAIGQTYRAVFDLYAIDSWDGTPAPYGPDSFRVSANGTQVFSHTLIHDPGWMEDGCTYPYSADQYGAYGFNSGWSDGIYRRVEVIFTAASTVTTLAFSGSLTDEAGQGFNDESWGIDNLSVTTARFLDVSAAKGVNVQTTTSVQNGSGCHWADLDNDGDLDAILTGGATSRLMKNNLASGAFTVSTFGGGAVREQGALADYDNDGDLDFWSCEDGSNGTQRLYTNNGAASFTNAGACGFSGASTNEGCAAADLNADGWADLVVFSSNGNWIGHNQASASPAFSATNASSYGLNDSGDYGARGYAAAGDVNNDGRPDFFYRYNNGKLFASDGDGTYTENARGISVLTGGYEDTAAAWGDYDNDGDLDLFVPRTTAGYIGTLWRNDVNWTSGSGSFTNVTSAAGLTLDNKPAYSGNAGTHSGCWGDYDNDGDLDLFIVGANGNSLLYQNQGGGVFSRAGEGISVGGNALDAVFVDYDNDGDLDLSVTRNSAPALLFENRTNNSSFLKVRLIGRGAGGTNKAAIGTRVELWNAAGTTRLGRREIGVARGYGGSEPLWAHFGGVNPNTTYLLKVYFQSRPVSDPQTVLVTPASASTTIGTTTIPQMVTVQESSKLRVVQWSEVRNMAP